jgi:type III restriction enzyme
VNDGIKVLSLFFIDRVANYVDDDGIIRRLFDQEFNKAKKRSKHFEQFKPDQVREAYFAKARTRGGEEQAIDTPVEDEAKTKADREAERAAFGLIMRKKEQLLSLNEPVAFIFAHSALKEGWDNPNVFQICTLNQTVSEIKKRQEIGRGLRLCVNQRGERIRDDEVNVLTVVANESYRTYAAGLQQEYVDAGEAVAPPIRNARRKPATRNDQIFSHKEFHRFWDNLARRTAYRIHVETETLVKECIERLNATTFPQPVIVVERGEFIETEFTITVTYIGRNNAHITVQRRSTDGSTASWDNLPCQKGQDLEKITKDERLRGFRITEINEKTGQVFFRDSGDPLMKERPIFFHTEAGQVPRERAIAEPDRTFPVFNLLDRVARETGLTRPTVNHVFRGMKNSQKLMLLKNPEGFASHFSNIVRDTLADHVASRVEFVLDKGKQPFDLDKLFPEELPLPEGEMTEADEHGLYDFMQTDSDVEQRFVTNKLAADDRVLLYFKFLPKFRIDFPKIIGDYVPDWGVVRLGDDGKLTLHLVRETKGQTDLSALEHPQEKRKIICAHKHFLALGIDYRHVDDRTMNWWHPEPKQQTL